MPEALSNNVPKNSHLYFSFLSVFQYHNLTKLNMESYSVFPPLLKITLSENDHIAFHKTPHLNMVDDLQKYILLLARLFFKICKQTFQCLICL